jgi:copper chaperone NosL
MSNRPEWKPTRRTILQATAVGSAVALAGCQGDAADTPEPATLEGDGQCDQCSMVVGEHPGPKGQAYFLDDAPSELEDREDGHARFCSVWCLYKYTLEAAATGPTAAVSYATDYSSTDYELGEEAGTTVIDPTPQLDAGVFSDVTSLHFVVDSEVIGSMGSSLIGFATESEAQSFSDEYGGEVLEHDDISLDMINEMSN